MMRKLPRTSRQRARISPRRGDTAINHCNGEDLTGGGGGLTGEGSGLGLSFFLDRTSLRGNGGYDGSDFLLYATPKHHEAWTISGGVGRHWLRGTQGRPAGVAP